MLHWIHRSICAIPLLMSNLKLENIIHILFLWDGVILVFSRMPIKRWLKVFLKFVKLDLTIVSCQDFRTLLARSAAVFAGVMCPGKRMLKIWSFDPSMRADFRKSRLLELKVILCSVDNLWTDNGVPEKYTMIISKIMWGTLISFINHISFISQPIHFT